MVRPIDPIHLCDVHQRDNRRVIADPYVIHIDGPQGRLTVELDVCATEEMGRGAHDVTIRALWEFMERFGTEIKGAELILPEDRKVITPREVFHPELTPAPKEEPPKPHIFLPGFSDEGKKKESKEEVKLAPQRAAEFYSLVKEHVALAGINLKEFASEIGLGQSTLYALSRIPPSPEVARAVLQGMGKSAEEVARLTLRYATLPEDNPEEEPEVIDRTGAKKVRIPSAVQEGNRVGGLNETAVYGNGQTRGNNPVLGTAH